MPNPNKPPRKHTGLIVVLVILMLLMIAGTALMIKLCLDITDKRVQVKPGTSQTTLPTVSPAPTETEPPETTLPTPEHVVSTATIVSTGDLLMHKPVIDTGYKSGSYDFESIFRYLSEYTMDADLAVANLETTLCSTDNGYSYSGYPNFNCPDALVDGAKDAGFDILLNASNHSYDTSSVGMHRTMQVIQDKGLIPLGIVENAEDKHYIVEEVNGINIGMICYTYETDSNADRVALNGLPVKADDAPLINCFDYNALDTFYAELRTRLEEMKADGAEATVLYLHWGTEYQLQANETQKKMAQKICDLGVDVLIGGHPHVVQPMDLISSTTDEDHKMVCLYSMGNAVSNQRQGNLSAIATAHTEDGVLFSITFSKYSDGTVYLESTDLLPLWVYRRSDGTGNEYNIMPLDMERRDEWTSWMNFQEYHATAAENSYNRTMAIVGEGLTACQEYLKGQYEAREEYYYDLAFHPEKYATEPTQAPTEAETTAETVAP